MLVKGSEQTKEFYDSIGWHFASSARPVDGELFGVKEDGPLRQRMHDRKWFRIMDRLNQPGQSRILEVGCGGSPEVRLLGHFKEYVGTDFSKKGLQVAAHKFRDFDKTISFVEADATKLPFEDNAFDTVYSAHMLYHIDDRASQAAALSEMLRVLRVGGNLVLQTANPRPLLFPLRLVTRVVADTPGLSDVARRLKGPSPIPYMPPKLGWYMKALQSAAHIEVFNGGIASTAFNRGVSETTQPGALIWSMFDHLDAVAPRTAAQLGNYAVVFARK